MQLFVLNLLIVLQLIKIMKSLRTKGNNKPEVSMKRIAISSVIQVHQIVVCFVIIGIKKMAKGHRKYSIEFKKVHLNTENDEKLYDFLKAIKKGGQKKKLIN